MPAIGFGRGIGMSGGHTKSYLVVDSDAIAYLTAIGDIPGWTNGVPTNNLFAKAVDQLVLGHKSASVWTKLHWAFIAPPTMGTTSTLTNLKNATLNGSAAMAGNTKFGGTYPCGYFLDPKFSTYFVHNLAVLSSDNSSCFVWAQTARKFASAGYAYGADNAGATEFLQLNEYGGTSGIVGRVFSTATVVTTSNTTPIGRYIANRNSSTYLEVVKDNSILGTNVVAHTGTTPNIHCPIGARNNNTTINSFGDGCYSHQCNYDGLTLSERSTVDGLWASFMATCKRQSPVTQIIVDGNSLTTYGGTGGGDPSHRMVKRTLYTLSASNKYPVTLNYGIGGQNTSAMSADFATQIVPKLNSLCTNNFYIPWEITNDFRTNGNTTNAINNYWTLCDTARAAGFKVVAMTLVARDFTGNGAGLTETNYNLGMNTINQAIRADWALHADYLCDITNANLWLDRSSYASDAAYNTAISGVVNNGTYFLDGTHLVNAGYDIVGNTLAAVLLPIV